MADFYAVFGNSEPEPDGGDVPAALDYIHDLIRKHASGDHNTV
jgi:hypothetical protein